MLGLVLLLQALTVAVSGPPTSPAYLPLRVAVAEGYFQREGLTVTLKTTRAEVGAAEALAQGEADLAATSLEAMLRFGPRPRNQAARLVLALTAAPPVALVVPTAFAGTVRSIEDLAGRRVGVTVPGAPEQAWFSRLLARAGVRVAQVELVSLGSRGLVSAIENGDVQAGLLEEPHVSRLVREGRAAVLADARVPEAVKEALGVVTVNAAVFARADRQPRDRNLVAFARAVLAAVDVIARSSPDAIAARLPRTVVGLGDEFARRIEATRGMYLPDGWVEAEQLSESIALIRAHQPLPVTLRVPRADDMLHTAPLRRAIQSRN
ncbi:MAG: ABC transporter substrate-binding protein [Candidatus Rokuibacteriota bacterium]